MLGLGGVATMSPDYPGTPPGKTAVLPPPPVAQGFYRIIRPPRPIVCPLACFEGQSRAQTSVEVTWPLLEGFDGPEDRRLLVQQVSDAARKGVAAFILHYAHCPLQHALACADRDTKHRPPSFFNNADVDAFNERNILGGRGRGLAVVVPRSWPG